MGPRVNGSNRSTGQRVTFTILYMIADDARLTPPCCKKHTTYHYTRLMPHRCKKHTASFARSTGKFPSVTNNNTNNNETKEYYCNRTIWYMYAPIPEPPLPRTSALTTPPPPPPPPKKNHTPFEKIRKLRGVGAGCAVIFLYFIVNFHCAYIRI